MQCPSIRYWNSVATPKAILFSVITLFGFLLLNTLYSQQSDYEKGEMRRYKIKKVTTLIDSYTPPATQSHFQSKFTSEFDNRGNLVKRIGYDGQTGLALVEWRYKYDSRDHTIEAVSNGSTQTASYKYDNAGHLLESKVFDAGGNLQRRQVFILNAQGKEIEDKWYDGSGNFTETHNSKYDSLGNLVEYSETKADGSLISKKVHTFNAAGNATQILVYGADGRLSSKTIYKYDAGEHQVERASYAGDGTLQTRHILKRDAKGFEVEDAESNSNGQTVTVTKSAHELYP
jgi:hypothetical protein